MLNYSLKGKTTLQDLMNTQRNVQRGNNYNLNPKFLPTRPPALNISTHRSPDSLYSPNLTPKSSRSAYNPQKSQNTSINRTYNPDMYKTSKENSFNLPLRTKGVSSVETSFQKEQNKNLGDCKTERCDRSQKALKTKIIKDSTDKDEIKSFLRQTVSNANVWQLRNMQTTSPIKEPMTATKLQKVKSSYEPPSFRKKIQSQYLPSYAHPEIQFREAKQKRSTRHSRQNSGVTEEKEKTLETLNFNFKSKTALPPNSYSQRKSQDKMPISTNLRKDKTMSQTDPMGCFQKIGQSQRTSANSIKRKDTLRQISIEDFNLGSCKGQGRFGKVFPAIHKKSGFLVAIKQIKKQDVRLMLDQFIQQIKINTFTSHPNVVRMYNFFCDQTCFYIMMEYMEQGSLYKQIKMKKKMQQEQVSTKLYQICDAVNYLHQLDILHRDIKPQNIVISNGVCKLCDFGWATYSKDRRNTYCGTLDYVCPEILEGQSYDNFVDIWAIGVLAYEMLAGKAPFYHISRKQTMKSIMNCQFSFPTEMSINAKMFIKKALKKIPDQRFTIESLLNDRFLSGLGKN